MSTIDTALTPVRHETCGTGDGVGTGDSTGVGVGDAPVASLGLVGVDGVLVVIGAGEGDGETVAICAPEPHAVTRTMRAVTNAGHLIAGRLTRAGESALLGRK